MIVKEPDGWSELSDDIDYFVAHHAPLELYGGLVDYLVVESLLSGVFSHQIDEILVVEETIEFRNVGVVDEGTDLNLV